MRKVGFGVIGCGVISTAYLKAAQRFANLNYSGMLVLRGLQRAYETEINDPATHIALDGRSSRCRQWRSG